MAHAAYRSAGRGDVGGDEATVAAADAARPMLWGSLAFFGILALLVVRDCVR